MRVWKNPDLHIDPPSMAQLHIEAVRTYEQTLRTHQQAKEAERDAMEARTRAFVLLSRIEDELIAYQERNAIGGDVVKFRLNVNEARDDEAEGA